MAWSSYMSLLVQDQCWFCHDKIKINLLKGSRIFILNDQYSSLCRCLRYIIIPYCQVQNYSGFESRSWKSNYVFKVPDTAVIGLESLYSKRDL